jgi:hypothetical protein
MKFKKQRRNLKKKKKTQKFQNKKKKIGNWQKLLEQEDITSFQPHQAF